MSFTSLDFRKTMGRFATGVSVVTTLNPDGTFQGITVNSFTSVSLDPPLVLICIDKKTYAHSVLLQSGVFCINILTRDQEYLSDRFAGREPDNRTRFTGVPLHFETTGAPVFDNTLGFADCRIVQTYDGGDHTIFLGEVLQLGHAGQHLSDADEPGPLVYYKSGYRTIED